MGLVTHGTPRSEHSSVLSASNALSQSLRRALKERKRAVKNLASDPVHDLRVALRRSRTFAEGFSELDPSVEWRVWERLANNYSKVWRAARCSSDVRGGEAVPV